MIKSKKKNLIIWIVIIFLLVVAWLCRVRRSGDINGWARCFIQCSLLLFWTFSIKKRIISPIVR